VDINLDISSEHVRGWVEDVHAAPSAVPVVGGGELCAGKVDGNLRVVIDRSDSEGGVGGVVLGDVGGGDFNEGFATVDIMSVALDSDNRQGRSNVNIHQVSILGLQSPALNIGSFLVEMVEGERT
jgi:hypothetical protein